MAASRTPSLGPSPLFSPPSVQLLLWPCVQSLWGCSEDSDCPQAGITWVSQEPSLPGWKPSFPQALLSSGVPLRCLLLSVSPHHPASAFLSSHSLWSQLQQYHQNRAPRPSKHAVHASVPSLMLFHQNGMLLPCSSCLVCLANTYSSLTIPLKGPLLQEDHPRVPPPPGYLSSL